jgi:RNA polymerase II elongation factor ELL
MLSAPSSPMHKRPPTSQPGSTHDAVITALRVPVIHLLARQPTTDASLAQTCRTSQNNMRALLPKIAKRSSPDTEKWQLTDKAYREINPFKFPYASPEDRQQAIDNAIKAFDRQRLEKDDKLWQILLPREERGQGVCLSRSKVKAPEAKPKASTPMHKISDLTKRKPAAKKADDKPAEKKIKVAREPKEPEVKAKPVVKERPLVKDVKYEPKKATTSSAAAPSSRPTAPADRYTSSNDPSKSRSNNKKAPAAEGNNTPRVKPKMSGRDHQRERPARPVRPAMPINTKPKNPSPLSASPPVNASDFEDGHPVHKALAAAASPPKSVNGNSDRSLKRKANDIDSDIHNHNLAVKKPHTDRATPNHTPSHTNGRLNGSTPSSTSSLKRKSDESSSSNTPYTASKVRRVNHVDTGLASRYHSNNNNNNSQVSPGASSSSTTSPTIPSLSFRQTVELSQRFQKYYKKYEELYWQLTEADKAPTEAQRNDLLKMHKKLEEMKREIKAGAVVHR